MEALFGIAGLDFVLLAADKTAARSIVVMKSTEEKFRPLNATCLMTYCGEAGDTVQFAEYIQRNVQLYGIKNDRDLGVKGAAHFTRQTLAESLRSRSPYSVNLLIGGCDATDGPQLYWIDYLSTLTKVPFAAHGYGAYFCLSLLDRHYRPNLTADDAIDLLRKCLAELKVRFIVNLPEFSVKIVRSTGVEDVVL